MFRNEKNYIRPLDKDIEEVFNSNKNKFFRNGTCERFLFKNAENQTVGKVAVFVNPKYEQKLKTGGIGFLIVSMTKKRQISSLIFVKIGCRNAEWKQWTGR